MSIETKDSTRTLADVGERQIDHRSLAAALISDASEVIALAAVSMAESVRAYGETIKALREGKSIPIVETPYADILVDRLRGCGVLDDEEES